MNTSSKTLILWFSTIIITGVVYNQLSNNQPKNIDELDDFPSSTKYLDKESALKCTLEKIQVQEVSSESEALDGSNYLKTWVVSLTNSKNKDKKAYLITSQEDPWAAGQEYFVSTNCIAISEEEKGQMEKQVEDGCTGLYLWDKENYQITRECGYVINDHPVFFKFKQSSNF